MRSYYMIRGGSGPRAGGGWQRLPFLRAVVPALAALFLTSAAAAAANAPASRAQQIAATSRPSAVPRAHPRALTAMELSQRVLLGRFKDQSPSMLGLVWKSGRDPKTCADAWTLAKAAQNAVPAITEFLVQMEGGPRLGAAFYLGMVRSVAGSLEARARYDEADQFLQARLRVRLSNTDDEYIRDRREGVGRLIAELYAPTRPAEAERILNGLVADREAVAAKVFAQFRGQPRDGPAWTYGKAWYDFSVLAARYNLLRPFYASTGRLEEALAVARAMDAHLASKRTLMTSNGAGYSQLNTGNALPDAIKTLSAQIALRDGRSVQAEALLRDCCGDSPELARLLLREGKREDARVVLSRRMLEVNEEIEQLFWCMRQPATASVEKEIAAARKEGEEMAIGSGQYRFSLEIAQKQVRLLIDSGNALAHAIELGDLLNDAGLPDDARDVLRPTTALAALALGSDHPITLRALAASAREERLYGAPASAVGIWTTWRQNGDAFLRDRLWRVSEDDRRRFFRDDRRNIDLYLSALREAKPSDAGTQALAITLRHKGMLASVAGELGKRAHGRNDPKAAALLAQLVGMRAQFAGFALHNRAGTPEARLVRRQMSEVEAQLGELLGTRSADEPMQATTPRAVLAALRPGEALIDLLVFADPDAGEGIDRERMVAVVARAGEAPALLWWANVAPVRAAAARFRAAILGVDRGEGREREIGTAGRALYDLLWRPLLVPLGNATRILLVPDDILNVVPLAALPDAAGRPLIHRYQISMLSAARDVLEAAPSEEAGAPLVLGNPSFDASPDSANARGEGRVLGISIDQIHFSPLPGTLTESQQVSAMLVGSKLLDGDAATKAAVTTARSPSILHLATHGFFLSGLAGAPEEGDPLVSLSRSGLAFARANIGVRAALPGSETQGILTALEATSLDLRDTRLVVLSACETGLGEVASGEGVYGLAQALHEAGARAVLATLWPVSDKATAVFMQRFYARLAAGDEPQVAIRTVQLSFAAEGEWHDPIYWAPFVLTGR